MRPHPRIRKTVKWGGAVVCAVVVAAWVGSAWRMAGWVGAGGDGIGVYMGGVTVWRSYVPVSGQDAGWVWMELDPRFMFWFNYQPWGAGGWAFSVPLWVLLVPLVMCTADAWRQDRLARRGAFSHLCIRCGYDRTGLAPSAVCPECGSPAPVAASAPIKGI